MNFIRKTLAENLTSGNKVAPASGSFTHDEVPDLSGKVAVVTGGSEGIGYGVSFTLLAKDISKLFMISTSKEVVDGATEAIRSELGEDVAKRVKWLECDLSDWNKTAQIANEISKSTDRLDILVNNAGRGIMTQQFVNGIDRHMAINPMGHVVLTSHLLPLLKKTADGGNIVRISNQASNAHESAPKDQKFDTLEDTNRDLGPMGGYGRSKLATILYSRYLARHLTSSHPKILVNATHPGVVKTKMSEEDILEPYPLGGYAMKDGLAPFKKDQFEGALSTLYAVTVTEKSGQYICPPAIPEEGSPLSRDEKLQDDLMTLIRELVEEKTKSQSADKGCPFKDY